jgi:2-polyprenyl-3-methyl-5-hydroxy-6-metoxy-1,4-benzoquinol methylase
LDIGCSQGYFVSTIHKQVQLAIGIDTNPSAVSHGKASGLDIRLMDVIEFAQMNTEMFDVICCFHVIEHLERVKPFIKAAISCLKPNGLLIISVPNRYRIFQNPLEPLDCPPHHVSRWDTKTLMKLGEIMNFSLSEDVFEMASRGAAREWFRESYIRNDKIPNWMKRGVSHILFWAPCFDIYKRVRLLQKWGFYRLTMLAYYRKMNSLSK